MLGRFSKGLAETIAMAPVLDSARRHLPPGHAAVITARRGALLLRDFAELIFAELVFAELVLAELVLAELVLAELVVAVLAGARDSTRENCVITFSMRSAIAALTPAARFSRVLSLERADALLAMCAVRGWDLAERVNPGGLTVFADTASDLADLATLADRVGRADSPPRWPKGAGTAAGTAIVESVREAASELIGGVWGASAGSLRQFVMWAESRPPNNG